MPSGKLTRRGLLAGAASSAAAATAGCFSDLRSRITYDPAEQVELTLKTVPADRDPESLRLGRELRDNLDAVGVDVTHELLDEIQLLRDCLINHDYDLFITEFPGHTDPDELRTLLGSVFAEESGLQNPFGHASPGTDQLLEEQRRPSDQSRATVTSQLQRQILAEQPFVVIASRRRTVAVDTRLSVPEGIPIGSPLSYLLADRGGEPLETLDVGLQRPNVTANRNPLAIEYRLHDRLTDLLYDPLVRWIDGKYVPWLADSFSVDFGSRTVRVQLREDLTWHDGEALTAEDVAFTYRFLADTALGGSESAVPAPRFRQQSSLVNRVDVVDSHTLDFEVLPCRPGVYPIALTAPILPPQEWRDRSSLDHAYYTKAITASVESPVGSGPLQFASAEADQSVTFERFDDHFLRTDDDLPSRLQPLAGRPVYRRLVAEAAPNIAVTLDDIAGGGVDILDGNVPTGDVDEARSRPSIRLVEGSTPAYYLLGINNRRHPTSNFAFRQTLARLLDRDHLVDVVFDGLATPTETPLHDTDYVPPDIEWSGVSSAGGFPGKHGNLDRQAARELFEEAGFRYHDGELRGR